MSKLKCGGSIALAGLMLVVAPAAAGSPAGGTGAMARLDPVVVTASPVETATSQAMQSVEVITRADIEASTATHLADLLAGVGGVVIRRRGAPGVQADLGVRGSNFEQTLVLVDGMPIHNAQTGHHALNVPVPLVHIDRIEIIKGPGALQYGGSATGGVVNLVTRRPVQQEGGLALTLGSHGTHQQSAHLGAGDGRVSQLLSATLARTDGEYSDRPTDANVWQSLYTGYAQLPGVDLSWGLGAARKEYGAWGFYSDAYPDARERIHSRLGRGGARFHAGDWRVGTDVYWHGYRDRFATRVGDGEFVNLHETEVLGIRSDALRPDAHGTTAVGLDRQQVAIDSSALSNHRRRQLSLWLARRQQLGEAWQLELAVNRVEYSDYGIHWLPAAGLSWAFAPDWNAFASAARSVRQPSYTELYMQTAANRGNPTLGPERAEAAELGVAGNKGQQWFRAAVFERRLASLIDWTRRPGQLAWEAESFSGYRARGVELAWQWRPGRRWMEHLDVDVERMQVDVDTDGRPIAYALQVPRHTLGVHWRARLAPRLGLGLEARRPWYQGQGAATLVGARLTWRGERFTMSLEGSNLLDARIIESGFAPIPGRWLQLTLEAGF